MSINKKDPILKEEFRTTCKKIQDDVLEASVCKTLSLTGVIVAPEYLHACHRMKRSGRVIIKFKCRKQNSQSCINAGI